jgi:hypothetical protein
MPDDTKKKQPEKKQPEKPPRKVGEGLDRSNEGAVEVAREHRKPAPPGAPADRYTTDSRRKS